MNLYVSNLSYEITDPDLLAAFEAYGVVSSARVINDRESGRSRGFGFVEMPNNDQALAAIKALDNQDLGGRPLKVVEARPKEERPGGFGGGRKPSGGGGGGAGRRDGGGGGGGRRDGGGYGGGGGRDGGGYGGGGGGRREKERGHDRGHRGGGGDDW
jgi:cold-inducible RNA-binding protein